MQKGRTEPPPTGCCGGGDGGPPIDKGWAWVVCLGKDQYMDKDWTWFVCQTCGVLYFVGIGINKSLGIILVIIQEQFQSDPSLTSITVSMAAAGLFFFVTLANGFGLMIGYRPMTFIGAIIVTLAMLATAYASSIIMVIFTLGLVSGMGYSAIYGPPTVVLSTYFSKRRALAIGLSMAGGSLGAITLPLLLRYLLEEYGFQGALLILTGIILQTIPAAMLLRPISFYRKRSKAAGPAKVKPTIGTICKKMADKELLCNPLFIYLMVVLVITQMGYLGTLIFMPTIFNSAFNDENLAYLVPTIIGASDFVGRLLFGVLADVKCIPKNYLLGVSLVIPGVIGLVAYLFLSKGLMIVSAIATGLLAGAYVPLMSPIIVEYFGLPKVSAGFGILTFCMGIAVIGLPIGMSELGKSSGYQAVFLLGSLLLLVAGVLAMPLDVIRRVLARRARANETRDRQGTITDISVEKEALGVEGLEDHYEPVDGLKDLSLPYVTQDDGLYTISGWQVKDTTIL